MEIGGMSSDRALTALTAGAAAAAAAAIAAIAISGIGTASWDQLVTHSGGLGAGRMQLPQQQLCSCRFREMLPARIALQEKQVGLGRTAPSLLVFCQYWQNPTTEL
jgi:hypothetical protein